MTKSLPFIKPYSSLRVGADLKSALFHLSSCLEFRTYSVAVLTTHWLLIDNPSR